MNEENDLTQNIIQAIESKNGEDIQVIDLDGLSVVADNFIITSAGNERQVKAIADEVEDKLAEAGYEPLRIEGKNSGRWILIDYGDSIVHVFHDNERAFYNLERLWKEDNNIKYIEY